MNDAPAWVAALAAAVAASVSLFSVLRVRDLRVSIDGRMGQLIEATQALGREEGKAIEKAEASLTEVIITNGHGHIKEKVQ